MLIYSAITSLDGYTADTAGQFDWCAPDEEVHAHVNEIERPTGTYLYGRRMYEVMAYWETIDPAELSAASREFTGIWRAADKIVYSTTLASAASARTRIERSFDPEAVRELTRQGVVSVGGPTLAAQAIKAGLVDEYHLYLAPILVGGGTPALPQGTRTALELVSERRFASGFVYLHYRRRG